VLLLWLALGGKEWRGWCGTAWLSIGSKVECYLIIQLTADKLTSIINIFSHQQMMKILKVDLQREACNRNVT
jgi:hypothetical protein